MRQVAILASFLFRAVLHGKNNLRKTMFASKNLHQKKPGHEWVSG